MRSAISVWCLAACLTAIEDALRAGRSRLRRLRWRFSLRSLRASTRSPVIA